MTRSSFWETREIDLIVRSPTFRADDPIFLARYLRLRGGRYFTEMQARNPGRCMRNETARVGFHRGCATIMHMPLPTADITAQVADMRLAYDVPEHWKRFTVDLVFPLMEAYNMVGDAEEIIDIIDNREVLLANLRAADGVTVSQPEWMADLPDDLQAKAYVLPDIGPQFSARRFGERFEEIAAVIADAPP